MVKKKKGRVPDAKTVTQLNSVSISFVNTKENGGSLAKAPAARGLRRGPRSVGRVRAPLRGPHRVLRVRAGGTPEWAESWFMGRAVKSVFQFFSELQMFIQYSF